MTPAEEDKATGKVREIKVTDRRMFTPDGEPRFSENGEHDRERATPASGEAEREGPRAQTESAPRTATGDLPAPGFADLVSFLAEPIALFLGEMPLPEGGSAENLDLARFHIDLLGVLRDKTKGNVSKEEAGVLDDLLYGLRVRYVQKRK